MSYERLELINGVTKWDAEKVQHLEDAIIANEEAINSAGGSNVNADWSQSDSTTADYVKNRTHYSEYEVLSSLISQDVTLSTESNGYPGWTTITGEPSLFNEGDILQCSLWNPEVPNHIGWTTPTQLCVVQRTGADSMEPDDRYDNRLYIVCGGLRIYLPCEQHMNYMIGVNIFLDNVDWPSYVHSVNIQLKSGNIIYHTLNANFIPDTIARAPKTIFNNIEDAPTASDFNTLLSILRESGILATE